MVAQPQKPRTLPRNFYRFGYIGFVATGIAFALMGKFADAAMFGGFALIFDPFDQTVPFPKRSIFQRMVLTAHILLTLGFIVLAFIK